MTLREAAIGLLVLVSQAAPAVAQMSSAPSAASFIDGSDGLTLSQAIETALSREPGIQSARASIDAARGFATQAGLRSNPSVSFAQQEEPGGTDARPGSNCSGRSTSGAAHGCRLPTPAWSRRRRKSRRRSAAWLHPSGSDTERH